MRRARFALTLIATIALVAFGFHMLDMHHEHPHELFGRDKIGAALHAGEKRWWLLLFLAVTALITAMRAPLENSNAPWRTATARSSRDFAITPHPLFLLFSDGVVHGKPF